MNETTESALKSAMSELRAGNKETARRALSEIVRKEPSNFQAWFMLSQAVNQNEQAIYCLDRVLKLSPNFQPAIEKLNAIQTKNNSLPREAEENMTQNPLSQISIENYLGQTEINSINGFEFEKLVGELLNRMGLNVQLTKKSGDGGIDIIAISDSAITGGKYVIQCKRYASKVGEPQIRDLFGVVHHENASKGILITNSDFTVQARKFAEGKPIELINGETFTKLIHKYEILPNKQHPNSESKILEVPKEQKELAINMLQIRDNLEIKLGELNLIIIEKITPIPETELISYLEKVSAIFSPLIKQLVNVINDFGSQSIEKNSTSYIRSRRDIVQQIINSHFKLIKTLRQINIVTVENIINPKLFEDLVSAYIELNKDYLRQLILFFNQFELLIELDGKRVDNDYSPKISIAFEPNLDESFTEIVRISNEITDQYKIYNQKLKQNPKQEKKKKLFGLF